MNELLKRVKSIGNSSMMEFSDSFDQSKIINSISNTSTPIYALNIALSGSLDKGLSSGLLVIAGPSKHFKTLYGLIIASAYMKNNSDAIMLFYDSEFGASAQYFKQVGIDPTRVLHCPFTTIEELRSDIAQKTSLENGSIKRGDKVFIFIDSLGNSASNKEVKDAEDENEKADMTRAKVMKSLFRIVTPRLRLLDIPLVAVNHTYQTMEMYSKSIVSGGTGVYYSSNDIWIVGRSQIKDAKDLEGFTFTINIEKSREVKEKAKIPISVSFKEGINRYTGLFDIARELGIIEMPKSGWYQRIFINNETGELTREEKSHRRGDVEFNEIFWNEIFKRTNFKKAIEETFKLGGNSNLIDFEEQINEL